MKSLLLLALCFLAPLALRADQFVVSLTATASYVVGTKIMNTKVTNATVIATIAEEMGTGFDGLQLVYDTTTDALLVVHKSDGSTLGQQFSFVDGFIVSNAAGTSTQRLAFIQFTGISGVSGTVKGPQTIVKNSDGSLKSFQWLAKFQFFQQAVGPVPNAVISGSFMMTKRFKPTT